MAQSLSRLWTHLIFSTKDRYPFLGDKVVRAEMHAYLGQMLRAHDCETRIVGGVEDHVHALFALSRKHPIASVIKEVKRTSSSWIKQTSRKFSRFYWQAGYAAFSVSPSNLDSVIKYIEDQEDHHKRITFQDEYRAFLKMHAVEYDETYVWD
jgi:REP element-mobilizing transposase RayT